MTFEEFHSRIHARGFVIVCLNDYHQAGQLHTFVAIQDKTGRGYHAEGESKDLGTIFQTLLEKIK